MYLSHYNLESKPFQMSTDPDFLWLGEKHKEALATLKYAVVENKGILALTGDVGTGKTTLINALIQSLGDDTLAATIYDPSLEVLEFFNIISLAFNMGRSFDSKGEFLIYFKRFLKEIRVQNKKVLLIIDEAQRISNELLEEIRLLSNLEDEYVRLLNIFFVGQNEFIGILKEYKNRALRQRITLRYHLEPLTLSETEAYTRHRLKIAGAKAHIFSSGAIQEIFSFSNGYPRLINIICDHALLSGYVREMLIITADIIKECKEELKISNLNMDQDTYHLDNEDKSKISIPVIKQHTNDPDDESELQPKVSDMEREERPRYEKKRSRSVAKGIVCIGLLAVIGLLAGYVFYSPVKTGTTPVSNHAFMQGKSKAPGQPEVKNDSRTSVSQVPEKKADDVTDRVKIGKVEDSRYYIVRGPEPKLLKEVDKKKQEIPLSVKFEPVADPAPIPETSGGNKEPEARVAALKSQSGEPKTPSPKPKPVLVEKKTPDEKHAKLDVLGKKDFPPHKDRPIDYITKTVAPAPSKKQPPPVMAKSFKTVQEPAAETTAPEEKKSVLNSERKADSESRKGIESQAKTAYNFAPENLQSHLNIFLSKYCRTYEKKQLDKFATFFTPDAMEKGRSFTSRLDQYRRTFEKVDSMNYRIELKRYAVQEGTGAIRIQGVFHARARLVEGKKWLENSGPIAMELVANGDSFQVRRLDY